jgi:type I site-specific restriction endonuclease
VSRVRVHRTISDDLLQAFRNSLNPRVVVTVDMIATGTDGIEPVFSADVRLA